MTPTWEMVNVMYFFIVKRKKKEKRQLYWIPLSEGLEQTGKDSPWGHSIQFYVCLYHTAKNGCPLWNGGLSVYEYIYIFQDITYHPSEFHNAINTSWQEQLHQHNGSPNSKVHCNSGSINSDPCAADDSTTFYIFFFFWIYEAHALHWWRPVVRGAVPHNKV